MIDFTAHRVYCNVLRIMSISFFRIGYLSKEITGFVQSDTYIFSNI